MTKQLVRSAILEAKSVVRAALGIPDPWKAFRRFEASIHRETWERQGSLLKWARENTATRTSPVDQSTPIGRALGLRQKVLDEFKDARRVDAERWRILIHLPPFSESPAGHFLFRNLGSGLAWLGLPVQYWDGKSSLAERLKSFEPSLILSIDHWWLRRGESFVGHFRNYRKLRKVALGLSSNHFTRDQTVLRRNFGESKAIGVDFFYSFQCPEFVAERYEPFRAAGFPVASVEFGANPLVFFPLPGVERDIDFVFLGSSNAEKWDRCFSYFCAPWSKRSGLILGPGWTQSAVDSVADDEARSLYARARVGMNLHVPFQIAEATELNERTYNLAACAVPQLVDIPALLPQRFSEDSVFIAQSPREYEELFEFILSDPEEATRRGVRSMEQVLASHTVFHRASSLLQFIEEHLA